MKTKKPQDCAHVADYYASEANKWGSKEVGNDLRVEVLESNPTIFYGGANFVISCAKQFLKYSKLAAREWKKAGSTQ